MSDKAWTRAARISKWICFLLAGLWLGFIVWAQSECSISHSFGNQCRNGEGDIWLLPFLYSPIGFRTVVASIIILISKR
jgi:hypothetical protein